MTFTKEQINEIHNQNHVEINDVKIYIYDCKSDTIKSTLSEKDFVENDVCETYISYGNYEVQVSGANKTTNLKFNDKVITNNICESYISYGNYEVQIFGGLTPFNKFPVRNVKSIYNSKSWYYIAISMILINIFFLVCFGILLIYYFKR